MRGNPAGLASAPVFPTKSIGGESGGVEIDWPAGRRNMTSSSCNSCMAPFSRICVAAAPGSEPSTAWNAISGCSDARTTWPPMAATARSIPSAARRRASCSPRYQSSASNATVCRPFSISKRQFSKSRVSRIRSSTLHSRSVLNRRKRSSHLLKFRGKGCSGFAWYAAHSRNNSSSAARFAITRNKRPETGASRRSG